MIYQDEEELHSDGDEEENSAEEKVSLDLASQDVTSPLELRALSNYDVERLHHQVEQYVKARYYDVSDPEDIAAQAVLEALEYSRKHEVRHWNRLLMTIARRLAAKAFRAKKQGIHELSIEEIDLNNSPASDSPVETPLLAEDLLRAVDQAINNLSPDAKAILIMQMIGEMSVAEIAKVLNVEIGTVRVRSFRAWQKLRQDPSLSAWKDDASS